MRPIDADALLEELRKSCEYHAENSREFSLLQRDIIIVQEQPTVDAVPVKHGKWIKYPTADGLYQCSECSVLRSGESNYCSHCGARMDGWRRRT